MKKKITITESELIEIIKDVIFEENTGLPIYIRRRLPQMQQAIESALEYERNESPDGQNMFDDMFDFALYVIQKAMDILRDTLPKGDELLNDEDELEEILKDFYSEYLFDVYRSIYGTEDDDMDW